MTRGKAFGREKLAALVARLKPDLDELRVKIGGAVADEVEAAVVENFQRKRPEWPGYNKAYEAWRLAHGYTKMLVVHATLKDAITGGFDEVNSVVYCGIPAAVGGDSKLEKIARAHEFGCPASHTPERSYLRTGFNDARPEIPRLARKEAEKVVRKWS